MHFPFGLRINVGSRYLLFRERVILMLEGFLAFPLWLIVLISIGVPVLLVIPVVKAIFNARIQAEGDDTEGLVAVFGFIGTAFTLLLAFIIVNVWSDQVSAQNILFDETTTLESIIVETRAFDPKLAPVMKGLTIEYLENVRKYEIDTTRTCGRRPTSRRSI
jgi:hypothetical protein